MATLLLFPYNILTSFVLLETRAVKLNRCCEIVCIGVVLSSAACLRVRLSACGVRPWPSACAAAGGVSKSPM